MVYCVRSFVPTEKKVGVLAERPDIQRGGGRLDHRAERREFRAAELARGRLEHLAHFREVLLHGHERHQDFDFLLLGQPEQRAELGAGELRPLQEQAHAARAELRVFLAVQRRYGSSLSPPASSRRMVTGRLRNGPGDIAQIAEQLVLRGRRGAREVELLGAEKPHAIRAVLDHQPDVLVRPEIGLHDHALAIAHPRRLLAGAAAARRAGAMPLHALDELRLRLRPPAS